MGLKRYRNWPILWKIMTIPLISFVLIVVGTELVVLPRIEAWLLEQEKLKVRNVVELAYQQIARSAQAVDEGRVPLADAQREVISTIKQLRYGGSEYFWINDLAPRMVMHPTKPELDGTDLAEYKDPTGKLLFMEFVRVSADKGEGFVAYMWPKPGESLPAPKVSYVKLHKPWGWIIGSGLYVDTFKEKVANLHTFILGASLLLSLALVLLAWSIARGIKRSLDQGCAFATAVASGDLSETLAITRADEVGTLGNAFNAMVRDLKSMIGRITATTREVADTSNEIARASRSMVLSAEQQAKEAEETSAASGEIHQLIDRVARDVDGLNSSAAESSSAVIELAASIEEVAVSMESLASSVDGISDSITQMTDSIRQIDGGVQALTEVSGNTASSVLEFDTSIRQIEAYAKESADISEMVRADAETGRTAVDETIAGIEVIMRESQITAEAIRSLSEKAQNIGSIVTVIDEIAGQTSLLALNASIIAAQSGEHGKGFGIVAAEMKELAKRTGLYTREIAETIEGVQNETKRAVNAIAAAGTSVRTGEELSLKAGNALGKIVSGVEQAARQMAEIARATKEQAKGSELIRGAMVQVATMADSIADTSRAQRKGSESIHNEVGRVREFSALVMRSLKEQAKVSDQISHMSRHVSESSSRIQAACTEQTRGSQRIQQAVESINRSAAAALEATRVVDYGVARLTGSTEDLQQEMENFKL